MSENGSTASASPVSGDLGAGPVRFCPHCGAPLDVHAFVQEYWTASSRVFHIWCDKCAAVFDVTPTERVTTHEPAH